VYTDHFRFREPPFSITPDPAFLYLSPRHHEALGYLLYGTGESGGFVQLTGEVGTGKTTVIRTLLEQKLPSVDVALILNPRQGVQEFVQSICDELGISYAAEATLKQVVDALNRYLLDAHANGRRTVVIIDEAQNLSPELLEQVRLLTNLETAKRKLLRIMLIGQPELIELLDRPDLRQLAQRVTARFHLTALNADETYEYIAHRLRVVGGDVDIFEPNALKAVYRHSGGIPRLINVICDRALLAAYSEGSRKVTLARVNAAAREAAAPTTRKSAQTSTPWKGLPWIPGVALAGMMLVAFASVSIWRATQTPAAPEQSQSQAQVQTPLIPEAAANAEPEPRGESPAIEDIDTSALLDQEESLAAALESLIGLWDADVRVRAGENVCNALRARSLECHRASAGWDELQRFDRPALLTLQSAVGESRHVLLRALDESSATLLIDGAPKRISRDELDALWTGDYLMLWRRGVDAELIRPGDRGASVVWLRRALARAAGEPLVGEPNPLFDDALQARVQSFQRSNRLDVDGFVGAQTQMMLMQAIDDADDPSLRNGQADAR
jgi:general secretion pathway protein A